MDKIFVPVSGRREIPAGPVIEEVKKIGAARVFICAAERALVSGREERWEALLDGLREKRIAFENAGIETAVWISTIGYGGPLYLNETSPASGAKRYTPIRSVLGQEAGDANCPLDPDFTALIRRKVQDVIRIGFRTVMLDDEFCLSVRPGIGCACPRHQKALAARIGRALTAEELQALFTGAPTPERAAWLDLMGDTLRDFARGIRAAADEIDPSVRLGFSAGYTSWDQEGADALEITRILAGKNPPFLRFTGAPYWAAKRRFGLQPLPAVMETARMQAAWCRGSGVEVFTENDSFPHDRFHTPAAFLETFDLAIAFAEGTDTLKYFFEYLAQPDFEPGYLREHLRNAELRAALIALRKETPEPVGVRIYNAQRKLKNADLPAPMPFTHADEKKVMCTFFSTEQYLLSANAIPTVYEGAGLCGIAFGENAKYLTPEEIGRGLILDIKAARLLQSQGTDVGLAGAERMTGSFAESFHGEDRNLLYGVSGLFRTELAPGAEPLSYFVEADRNEERRYPSCYRYRNTKGARFLVYAFSAEEQAEHSAFFWSYTRARQLREQIPWLSGAALPAVCEGHPFLYQLCRRGNGKTVSAFFNCHPDVIRDAEIRLAAPSGAVRILCGAGKQTAPDRVRIDQIPPYGCAVVSY